MYLLHAQLAVEGDRALPADAVVQVVGCARPEDRIEHVALHPDGGRSGPVLGLFVLAGSLAEAERAARSLCLRALEDCPELHGFRLVSCSAVMPPAYYDALLERAGDTQEGQERQEGHKGPPPQDRGSR